MYYSLAEESDECCACCFNSSLHSGIDRSSGAQYLGSSRLYVVDMVEDEDEVKILMFAWEHCANQIEYDRQTKQTAAALVRSGMRF
jgi:hypothetical protein